MFTCGVAVKCMRGLLVKPYQIRSRDKKETKHHL